MYLAHVNVENIRSISKLEWRISQKRSVGWHVILGDNGSGKSTLLRAIALALIGLEEAAALRQDWNDWLTYDQTSGSIRLDLDYDSQFDKFSGSGGKPKNYWIPAELKFNRQEGVVKLTRPNSNSFNPDRNVWGGKGGWFSAAYGPFRRFTGGDPTYSKLFYSHPRLAAHLSVFGENIALTESLSWLQELQFKKLEHQPEGRLVDTIQSFINQKDFLPNQVHLESITSKGVEFVDGNGCHLLVENLSDGYRSILSMTFELIRQLANVYGPDNIFDAQNTYISVPGVVLIDEVDAHLHPTWQKQIGTWFCKYFPKIQFFVTTHSPLICQASAKGSVFHLPQPGSDETASMVTGDALKRLIYGNVLEAYGTELFGQNVTRSDAAKDQLRRLAELNQKELHQSITPEEKLEQQTLRATFPTVATTISS